MLENEKVFQCAWCIWSSITQRSLIRFIQAKVGGFSIRSFAISATEQQPTFIIKSKQLLWPKLFKGTGQLKKLQFVGLQVSWEGHKNLAQSFSRFWHYQVFCCSIASLRKWVRLDLVLCSTTGGPCISWFLVPRGNHEMQGSWIPGTVKPQIGSKNFLKSTFLANFHNISIFESQYTNAVNC